MISLMVIVLCASFFGSLEHNGPRACAISDQVKSASRPREAIDGKWFARWGHTAREHRVSTRLSSGGTAKSAGEIIAGVREIACPRGGLHGIMRDLGKKMDEEGIK